MSSPNVNDTPRSFSPHPMMSRSGSDHSRSQSRPDGARGVEAEDDENRSNNNNNKAVSRGRERPTRGQLVRTRQAGGSGITGPRVR